jgi:hypothetical protein
MEIRLWHSDPHPNTKPLWVSYLGLSRFHFFHLHPKSQLLEEVNLGQMRNPDVLRQQNTFFRWLVVDSWMTQHCSLELQ